MSFYASYPLKGGAGGIPTYPTFGGFPPASSVSDGSLAIALDTHILYESDGVNWFPIAGPGSVLGIADTDTIDLTNTAGVLTADLKISSAAQGASTARVDLNTHPDGLAAQMAFADTPSIDLSYTSGSFKANLLLSAAAADASNQKVNLDIQADGLRAQIPNSSIQSVISVADTTSIDMTYSSGVISGVLLLSAAAATVGNINTVSSIVSDGLHVQVPILVGDTGSGGIAGVAPAPAAGDAAAGKFLKADGTWTAPTIPPTMLSGFFGGGSDGIVTVSTAITLVRDMFYNNLTISSSGSIVTNGFRIFVAGTLDITAATANAINWNGNNGGNASGTTAGTPGASLAVNNLNGSAAGGNAGAGGAIGSSGGASAVTPTANPSNGGACGESLAGGSGGSGGSGGAGRVSGTPTRGADFNRYATDFFLNTATIVGGVSSNGGAGGGGGANNAGTGGTGGGGGGSSSAGGIVYVAANALKRSGAAAGAIAANGGNGGTGAAGAAATTNGAGGGGSGGAGAGGGWVYFVYSQLVDATPVSNLFRSAGGTGGAGGAGGTQTPTGGGLNGGGGNGGGGGGGGRITVLNLSTNVGVVAGPIAATSGAAASGQTGGTTTAGSITQVTL